MEINKPDLGVFKGMGRLEERRFENRKYFPNIRNINQFHLTHNHPNSYKTSIQSFQQYDSKAYHPIRSKIVANQSHFEMGNEREQRMESENKHNFRKYDFSMPPKPIKHSDEGIGINEYEQRTGEKISYTTTTKDVFSTLNKPNTAKNVKYHYTRTDRFNPITGGFKSNTSFGFEDFVPDKQRAYKANNFTLVPKLGQKYDIITGRKLGPY